MALAHSPVPIFLRTLAIHIRGKVADEGALVEGREIRAEKIMSNAVNAMMIDLLIVEGFQLGSVRS